MGKAEGGGLGMVRKGTGMGMVDEQGGGGTTMRAKVWVRRTTVPPWLRGAPPQLRVATGYWMDIKVFLKTIDLGCQIIFNGPDLGDYRKSFPQLPYAIQSHKRVAKDYKNKLKKTHYQGKLNMLVIAKSLLHVWRKYKNNK